MEDGWWIKGVRGAIKVEKDERDEIIKKGKIMVNKIMTENDINPEDIICAFFTITSDLKSVSPGRIMREMGLNDVPVLCSQEPVYENSLSRTIRTLILYYSKQRKVKHMYIGKTRKLRPDL